MHDHLHIHTSLCLYHMHTVSTLPFRHNTHMDTYTRSLSVTHTKSVLKKTRAHLKRPNPNKHKLELNSNIWKYCSVKNFHRKKSWVIFEDCFHTQKGSVDVLRVRHGDVPFDRPCGRGLRACTGFRIMAVVLQKKLLPKSNVYVYSYGFLLSFTNLI